MNRVDAPTTDASHGRSHDDDKHSDLCKVGYTQSVFNKENKFNGELKESIDIIIQTYEQYAWQYTLQPD